jgi:hypothetical protein
MTIKIVVAEIFEPPDIHITIHFEYPPDEMEQKALKELLEAWYLVGASRGFGPGFFHNATSLIFDGQSVMWYVDVGSASDSAIEVLTNCLGGYSEDHVPIQEVILGIKLE